MKLHQDHDIIGYIKQSKKIDENNVLRSFKEPMLPHTVPN